MTELPFSLPNSLQLLGAFPDLFVLNCTPSALLLFVYQIGTEYVRS